MTNIKSILKTLIKNFDGRLGTNLYEKAAKINNSAFLCRIQRAICFAAIRWKYRIGIEYKKPLRLHLGCGYQRLEGYINIDFRKTSATDLVCDIRKLPYPDSSVAVIETYHVVEHLPRHDLPKTLKEWHRVLFSGGKLIIEYPDFDEIVKMYLEGHEEKIDGIFGLQRFQGDYHHFGYNYLRMRNLLEDIGFSEVEEKTATDYHTKEWPSIRVECIKPE